MSEQAEFNLASFQSKVLDEIKTLHLMVDLRERKREAQSKLDSLRVRDFKSLTNFVLNKMDTLHPLEGLKEQKKIDELSARAKSFLEEAGTRAFLCPALQSVEGNLSKLAVRSVQTDAGEIAAGIIPLLFPAAHGQSISLEPDPMFVAICAWMIARTGIYAYCSPRDAQGAANPNVG